MTPRLQSMLPRELDPFEMDLPWGGGSVQPVRAPLSESLDRAEVTLLEGDAAHALMQLEACFDELRAQDRAKGISGASSRLFRLNARAHAALGDRELAAEQIALSLAIALADREPAGIAAAMLDGFTLSLAD